MRKVLFSSGIVLALSVVKSSASSKVPEIHNSVESDSPRTEDASDGEPDSYASFLQDMFEMHPRLKQKAALSMDLRSAPESETKPLPKHTLLVEGDSWGYFGDKSLRDVFARHSPSTTIINAAFPGRTLTQISQAGLLQEFRDQAKKADYIWLSIMGNDAMFFLSHCGDARRSIEACATELSGRLKSEMTFVLEAIHDANPKARVMGFGYDILALDKEDGRAVMNPNLVSLASPTLAFALKIASNGTELKHTVMPQCKVNENLCCNRILASVLQGTWNELQRSYTFVDALNLLGSAQTLANFSGASVGRPDLNRSSPSHLFADAIHPTDATYTFIFEHIWETYWQHRLGIAQSGD